MKALALFLIGLLAGAVITTVAVGRQLDSSHLERKALQNKVIELQDSIKRLEDSLQDQQNQSIRIEQVKVSLVNPPDPFAALGLEEAAQGLLSDLVGKDVGSIDLRLVHNIVNDRIVEVEGRRYKLMVRGIQLYRQVEVMLETQQLQDENNDP